MKYVTRTFLGLLLVVVFTILWAYHGCSNKSCKNIKSFVENYNFWSDPGLIWKKEVNGKSVFYSKDRVAKKLRKLLSPDCRIISKLRGGKTTIATREEFIDRLTKAPFISMIEQSILNGPIIEEKDGHAVAKMTVGFRTDRVFEVAECRLIIDAEGGNFMISEIQYAFREPKENETQSAFQEPHENEMHGFQDSDRKIPYNSKEGLGARYLGGGNFELSHPSFSPDGKKIVFSSLRHKSAEVYIVDIDGSNLTRLTDTPYWEINPSFTPDGKSILFTSDKEDYAGEPYLINLDGSNYRRLVRDYSAVAEAVYSPDGTKVAFTVQHGDSRDICIMRYDGSGTRCLLQSNRENSSLVFSPDGENIYFKQKWYDYSKKPSLCEEIFSITTGSGVLNQLTNNCQMKTPVAAANDRILFVLIDVKYNNELWMVKIDGTAQESILYGRGNAVYTDTKLLPNSNSIIFVDDVQKPFVYNLCLKELFGNEEVQQLTGIEEYVRSEPGISPDGKHIVYIGEPKGKFKYGKGNIRILSIDTGEIKTIGRNY